MISLRYWLWDFFRYINLSVACNCRFTKLCSKAENFLLNWLINAKNNRLSVEYEDKLRDFFLGGRKRLK